VKTSTDIVSTAGIACGRRTRQSTPKLVAPSIRAASINERGVERKKARIQKVPNATDCPIWGRIRAQ
jgi:hypothetical protein